MEQRKLERRRPDFRSRRDAVDGQPKTTAWNAPSIKARFNRVRTAQDELAELVFEADPGVVRTRCREILASLDDVPVEMEKFRPRRSR
jgi:hypothetical protein